MTGRALRVAMCGTFDVKNYGDLLFPLVLTHELGKRIPGIEVECFSYYEKTPPEWPFRVSPVNLLPNAIHTFDGVVIGGGHLIRFDKDIAAGYGPPLPDMHHPTSYWLFPALLAMEARVPLIWSAVGASEDLPAWGRELLKEALGASAYVSVRDAASQRVIQEVAGDREVLTIPDTVFGIRDLWSESRRGADNRYVVIQATHHLQPHADALRRLIMWLKQQQYEAVLLPISPALGDDPAILKDIVRGANVRTWTNPMEAVRLIANASAAVGVSLHMSITALTFGVPVVRPFGGALSKYLSVHDLAGVFPLEDYAKNPEPVHDGIANSGCAAKEIEAFSADLKRHWDRIAAILTDSPRPSGLASLLQRLPFLLENRDQPPEIPGRFWKRRPGRKEGTVRNPPKI